MGEFKQIKEILSKIGTDLFKIDEEMTEKNEAEDGNSISLKKDKFWYFKKSPANMVPASGGHLSGGWNHAGLFSFDLILSELLLEHDISKIDFISCALWGGWT